MDCLWHIRYIQTIDIKFIKWGCKKIWYFITHANWVHVSEYLAIAVVVIILLIVAFYVFLYFYHRYQKAKRNAYKRKLYAMKFQIPPQLSDQVESEQAAEEGCQRFRFTQGLGNYICLRLNTAIGL